MSALFVPLFSLLLLAACSEKVTDGICKERICTEEFRTVAVTFKDGNGTPIAVKAYSAIIVRNQESTQNGAADPLNAPGMYAVASDFNTKTLLPEGDKIDVTAVNPKTNQKKTVQFVVSGGKCACHIEKISGPAEVVFD
jgi:hypothetical protein